MVSDEIEPDAAGADDADDGRGAGVRFDVVEHLAGDHRQHLRDQAEADLVQLAAAQRGHALDRLAVGGLDGFGIELAEGAEIAGHDGEHAGEGAEPDDIDPDQRPDQRIDAADRVERAPGEEVHDAVGDDVARGEEAEREGEDGGEDRAEEGDGDGLEQRLDEEQGARGRAGIGRQHQHDEAAEIAEAR